MSKVTILPPPGKDSIIICLETGHSCFIKSNNGDGTEVPARFQSRAVREGCIISTAMKKENVTVEKSNDLQDKIIAAIAGLTPEEFNTSGFPELNVIIEKVGVKVTKAQLTKAFEEFQAQKA